MHLKKDYTGLQIENRIVLSFSRFTKNHHDPLWWVRCCCGFEFESLTQDLKRKECRNCRGKLSRKRPYESLYNTFVKKASKKHSVNISYEQFLQFTQIKECHYCGEKIAWLEWQTKRKNQPYKGQAYNLDRKDSIKPYSTDNCVVCCARCNLSKNNFFSYDEWKQLGGLIRSWSAK